MASPTNDISRPAKGNITHAPIAAKLKPIIIETTNMHANIFLLVSHVIDLFGVKTIKLCLSDL